jgi:hypothetical protein
MPKFGTFAAKSSAPPAPHFPPAHARINLTVPLDLAEQLSVYAAEQRASMNAAIRALLRKALQ